MDLVSFIEGKENNSFPEDFISSVFLSPHIQKDGVWTILYQGKKIKFMSLWNPYTGCGTQNLPPCQY